MKPIEERLWDFIDGTLNDHEMREVEQVLKADPAIKQLYEQFLSLSESLKTTELEEPSMRFTQNVMDHIASAPAPKPLVTKIDKRIINAIAGFFIATLGALVIYSLTKITWTSGGDQFSFSMPSIDWSKYFGSTFIEGSMVAFIIMCLFAIDRYREYARGMRNIH